MAHAEGVVGRLFAPRKGGEPAVLADAGHRFAPPGQYLVGVSLMAHVPHQTVLGRIEGVVQRHAEFDYAEPGTDESFSLGHIKSWANYPELREDPGNLRQEHLRCNREAGADDGEALNAIGANSRSW